LDAAESIDPVLAQEPMEKSELALPIDPIDRNDPTDPIDRIEPSEQIDKIELFDLYDQRDSPRTDSPTDRSRTAPEV
jgi:hypothetical protein